MTRAEDRRAETLSLELDEGPVEADLWLPDLAPPLPVAIIGHGWAHHRRIPYVAGTARHLTAVGVAAVAFDFPGHGERAAPFVDPRRDVAEAVVDVRSAISSLERDGRFGRIGYVGFSMGAMIGIHAAARERRLEALAAVVVGSTRVALAEGGSAARLALGEGAERNDPVDAAAAMAPRPVLMLNADRDEYFPREAVLALYDAFPTPKELVLFPGTHGEWTGTSRRFRTLAGFVAESLR